jgi:bacterioferritin-associated ferredoxin
MVTVRVSGYGGARCYELTQRAHDYEAEQRMWGIGKRCGSCGGFGHRRELVGHGAEEEKRENASGSVR